jgi:hypothetical protein
VAEVIDAEFVEDDEPPRRTATADPSAPPRVELRFAARPSGLLATVLEAIPVRLSIPVPALGDNARRAGLFALGALAGGIAARLQHAAQAEGPEPVPAPAPEDAPRRERRR